MCFDNEPTKTCADCSGCDERRTLHQILNHLEPQAPRYTSYPPANFLQDGFSESNWHNILTNDLDLNNLRQKNKFSLYVHLPFCESLCFFCACNRVITKNKAVTVPYLSALSTQIKQYSKLINGRASLNQLHFGGGTPNYLSPEQLKNLILEIKANFKLAPEFEFSIELDPRTCTDEHLRTLSELSCSRVSLGVQDFNPKVQKAVNRIQSFELTKNFVDKVRETKIPSIGFDLIYGLPEQTRETFAETMKQVLEIKPNRVAVYGYAHVPGQAQAQKKLAILDLPENHERLDLFLDAVHFFSDHGYKYLGLDHFVLENDPLWNAYQKNTITRSFMGYNDGLDVPVIGLGASAISIFPSALVQNIKDVTLYEEAVSNGQMAINKGIILNETDLVVRSLIRDLLSMGQVKLEKYRHSLSTEILIDANLDIIKNFQKLGLIELEKAGFKLTFYGQIFARAIAKTFDYRTVANPPTVSTALI